MNERRLREHHDDHRLHDRQGLWWRHDQRAIDHSRAAARKRAMDGESDTYQ